MIFCIQLSFDPMNHRTSLLIAYIPSISHSVVPSVCKWLKADNFLIYRFRFLILHAIFLWSNEPFESLLITWIISISHNVTMSVSKRTLASFESGPCFCKELSNNESSRLIAYSTSISHNYFLNLKPDPDSTYQDKLYQDASYDAKNLYSISFSRG